ncbi:MAG: hypothetical protein JXX14_01775 [Deltaproteobacteria bacterium]|nr:hypothetical protein [Deltaproteobacteria bacterium]
MNGIVIVENEFFTLRYHRDTKIIHHEFHQFIHDAAFRECLLGGLELMKKHGAVKWLSDDRRNVVLTREEKAWSQNVWRPKALESGWKFWAIVDPEKTVGKLGLQRIAQSPDLQNALVVDHFDAPEPAYEWLAAQ